jgi:hypothetical protein
MTLSAIAAKVNLRKATEERVTMSVDAEGVLSFTPETREASLRDIALPIGE